MAGLSVDRELRWPSRLPGLSASAVTSPRIASSALQPPLLAFSLSREPRLSHAGF